MSILDSNRPSLSRGVAAALLVLMPLSLTSIAHAETVGARELSRSAAQPVAPAQQAYQQGLQALADNKLDGAQQAFQEAGKVDPRFVPALLGLAEVAFRRQRLDEARQWIDKALQVNPRDANVQASLGRVHALKGNGRDARAALNKAIELDPSAVRPRMDLADLLLSQGEPSQALPLYRQVLVLAPEHAGAHYALGIGLLRSGDLPGAATELQRAADIEKDNPLPHVGLARLYAARNEPAPALAAVDKALALQPTLVDGLMLKGEVLAGKGRTDEALDLYRRAATAAPKLPQPHLRTAMLEQQRGRLEQAQVAYRQVLSLDGKHVVALNNLAMLAVERRGDLREAEAWAQQAVTLQPKVAQFHDTLGWVQRAQHRLGDARKTLETAVRLAPENPQILYHLGVAQVDAGDKVSARRTLQGALAQKGDFPEAAQARQLLTSMDSL